MIGVVNLDKPVGPTSHDMVGMMRRLSGTRRIGHAGTLDPLASGVLPILVGPATRFSEELTGGRKRYDALIRLGASSETDDAEGPITLIDVELPGEEKVRAALRTMVGTFEQRPPAFSARKHAGRVAHRAARRGEPIDVPPRVVSVDSLEVLEVRREGDGMDIRIDLRCGPGTYVRSIARDLGERLGTGGYLASLRRTEAAGLTAETAVAPETLERLAADGRLAEALLPVGDLLPLPRLGLDSDAARRFVNGSSTRVDRSDDAARMAVFAGDQLLGIGSVRGGVLFPDKVLPREAGE